MIRAVIFDFDEVIIRSRENHLKAFLLTLKKFRYKIDKKEIEKRFGKTPMVILKEIFPEWNNKKIKKFLSIKERTYREIVNERGIRRVKGIKGLLDFLLKNKIKIAICSASFRKNIFIGLEKTGLKNYFKIIVSAESVKKHKPNPDPLLKAAKLLKENLGNCAYIGDSIYEMQAAKRAKMIAIGVLTSFYTKRKLKESGATYVCKNMKEVKELISKLI